MHRYRDRQEEVRYRQLDAGLDRLVSDFEPGQIPDVADVSCWLNALEEPTLRFTFDDGRRAGFILPSDQYFSFMGRDAELEFRRRYLFAVLSYLSDALRRHDHGLIARNAWARYADEFMAFTYEARYVRDLPRVHTINTLFLRISSTIRLDLAEGADFSSIEERVVAHYMEAPLTISEPMPVTATERRQREHVIQYRFPNHPARPRYAAVFDDTELAVEPRTNSDPRTAARERGRKLLHDHLTADQRADFEKYAMFPVCGGVTGDVYFVGYDHSYNILITGTKKISLSEAMPNMYTRVCFTSSMPLVMGDMLLAQKYYIEHFEQQALDCANDGGRASVHWSSQKYLSNRQTEWSNIWTGPCRG